MSSWTLIPRGANKHAQTAKAQAPTADETATAVAAAHFGQQRQSFAATPGSSPRKRPALHAIR